MTPYPILNFIIWAAVVVACLVIGFLVVMWIADELDEESAAGAIFGARHMADIIWCKTC